MFEELEKDTEDMFAQTDAAAPQISAPTTPQTESVAAGSGLPTEAIAKAGDPAPSSVGISSIQPSPAPAPMLVQERMDALASKKRSFPWKVIVLFMAIVCVIALAFFLSMRILKSKTPPTPVAPETSITSTTSIPSVTTVPSVDDNAQQGQGTPPIVDTDSSIPAVDPNLDSDGDGLADIRETQLGTNPGNADTDGDGLTDREEVDVYHTNPLNPDTDADGYKDGDEVQKGYNPNGPGKLLVIPVQ